jgi:hypothetical protein
MKRRNFILSTAVGIGVVSTAAYYFLHDVEYDLELAKPQSLSLILDDATMKNIGQQYRESFPTEESERSLVKLLNVTSIEDHVISDFKNGNIVIIEGWILSQTEARQCALISAQQSR